MRVASAAELAEAIKVAGVGSIVEMDLMKLITDSIADKKSVAAREGAINVVHALHTVLGLHAEPYIVMIMPALIAMYDDKVKTVCSTLEAALVAFFQGVNAYAAATLLPFLFAGMETISWKVKCGCLKLLGTLAHTAPSQVGQLLPDIVPKVTESATPALDSLSPFSCDGGP